PLVAFGAACPAGTTSMDTVFSCFATTWSPTLIWAKFFTSGPASTSTSVPSASLSVTQRSLGSTLVTIAVRVSLALTEPDGLSGPEQDAAPASAAAAARTAANTLTLGLLFIVDSLFILRGSLDVRN